MYLKRQREHRGKKFVREGWGSLAKPPISRCLHVTFFSNILQALGIPLTLFANLTQYLLWSNYPAAQMAISVDVASQGLA